MIDKKDTRLPGCFELVPRIFLDQRGRFIKTFHSGIFKELDLATDFKEEYYSVSAKDVIRGIHFQKPPEDHEKLVYCTSGEVLDVVVDLRVDSPTYRQAQTFSLSAERANMIYIPKGFGHGFCALEQNTTLVYKVTSVYSNTADAGVLWSSIPVDWPVRNPVISERDNSFVHLAEFESPFTI